MYECPFHAISYDATLVDRSISLEAENFHTLYSDVLLNALGPGFVITRHLPVW